LILSVFILRHAAVQVCQKGSKVYVREYTDVIKNYTIFGPVLSTRTAANQRECELACHMADPDVCGMFNYYPSNKICELLYKDRPAEYKVEKKNGSTFKTRKVCIYLPCSKIFDS
jgi:hypothetical protein